MKTTTIEFTTSDKKLVSKSVLKKLFKNKFLLASQTFRSYNSSWVIPTFVERVTPMKKKELEVYKNNIF